MFSSSKDGRLSYVYNFMGEDEQSVGSRTDSPGARVFGVRYAPAPSGQSHSGRSRCTRRRRRRRHTRGVRTPGRLRAVRRGGQVGRNSGQPVCGDHRTLPFTGARSPGRSSTSPAPYIDRERELAAAFARD